MMNQVQTTQRPAAGTLCRSATLCTLLAAACLLCACAQGPKRSAAPSADTQLALLVDQESAGTVSIVREGPIALPPGVAPSELTQRGFRDDIARLHLLAALQQLRDAHQFPEPPPPAKSLSRDEEAEALRHYLRGRESAREGNHLGAVLEFQKARAIDPDSAEILRELAHAYAAENNAPRAIELFTEVLRRNPDDREARFLIGLGAGNQGDYGTAAAMFARPLLRGERFEHDPAAHLVSMFVLHAALNELGYDQAAIDAGLAGLESTGEIDGPSRYLTHVMLIRSRTAETLRNLGDGHCRLGRFGNALRMYEQAVNAQAQMPADSTALSGAPPAANAPPSVVPVDPRSLTARIVYANLQLGRGYAAERELLAFLQHTPELTLRDAQLCRYVRDHVTDIAALRDGVRALLDSRETDAGAVRVAASLLPKDEAETLILDRLKDHPRALDLAESAFAIIAPRNPDEAFALAANLMAREPDLAQEYAKRLVPQLAAPTAALNLGTPAPDPRTAEVRSRMLLELFAQGEAWQSSKAALNHWPDDRALRLLRIEIAGQLDEPGLVREAVSRVDDLNDDAQAWLIRARALQAVELAEEAMAAAKRTIELAGADDTLCMHADLALAAACATRITQIDDRLAQGALRKTAVNAMDDALARQPKRDEPYQVMFGLYQPTGMLPDPNRLRSALAALRVQHQDGRFYQQLAAQEELERNRPAAALERGMQLWESDRTDAAGLNLVIAAFDQQSQSEAAENWLRAQMSERPGDPLLLDHLSRLLMRSGRMEQAIAMLEERRSARHDDLAAERLLELAYQQAGMLDLAVGLGERRLRARPEGTRRALQLAVLYSRASRSRPALEELRWIAHHADRASLSHMIAAIGLASQEEQRTPEAAEVTSLLLSRAVEEFDSVPIQVYAVGLRSIARQGALDASFDVLAEQAAERARGAADGSAQAAIPWHDLAQRLADDGWIEAAGRALRVRLRAPVKFDPEAIALLTSMTLMADAATQPDAEVSINLLNELSERGESFALPGMDAPGSLAETLMTASTAYTIVGNDAGSEQLLRRSIALDPDQPMALNNLGYLLIEAGDADEQTARWIELAADREPDDPNVIDTLAWLRYKQGRFTEPNQADADERDQTTAVLISGGARELLERALKLEESPSAEMLDHYGDTLWRIGESEKAAEIWQRAEAILAAVDHRSTLTRNFRLVQEQVWGLKVADPEAIYDRNFGERAERIQAKLEAIERGVEPPVATTFAEN